ncbi:MAG: hypothetical protein J7L55_01435 [Desulfurococcales archaeon]|nr:hypothetical protein [Desulfurococcales archaeon]
MLGVVRALIEALDLTVYSYVKPGAPHRFSTRFKDLHTYVKAITSALETYYEASEEGVSVAKGRAGFTDIRVGALIKKAGISSSRYLETVELPEYHILLIPAVIAASYSIEYKGYMDVNLYQKAFESLTTYSRGRDAVDVLDYIRSYGGLLRKVSGSASITPGLVTTEGWSIKDLMDELGRSHRVASVALGRYISPVELSSKFIKNYVQGEDANTSAIKVYSYLLEATTNVKEDLSIKGKEDFMRVLRLDNELGRKGVNLSPLLPVMNESIFIAYLSLEFPKK